MNETAQLKSCPETKLTSVDIFDVELKCISIRFQIHFDFLQFCTNCVKTTYGITYLQVIKDKINDVKKQYAIPIYDLENVHKIPDSEIQFTINDQLFMETLLMEIRGKSISYSSHRKKESEKRENELINNIKELEANLSDTNVNEIEVLKEELKIIRQNKMQGILIKSCDQIIEEDEKVTNFFCNLEKHNFTS